MKVLSLKLKDDIFENVEKAVKELHMSRNAYINQALEIYNSLNRRRSLRVKLKKESRLAAFSSLEVLAEMERLEDAIVKD